MWLISVGRNKWRALVSARARWVTLLLMALNSVSLSLLAILAPISVTTIRPQSVFAQAKVVDSAFEALKARYFKLKNTDLECRLTQDWLEAGESLHSYAAAGSTHAPAAFFLAGLIFERLAEVQQSDDLARRALDNFTAIINKHPQDEYADDALVRRADLLARRFAEVDKARADYLAVIHNYPRSDQFGVAQARLRAGNPVNKERQFVSEDSGALRVMIDPGHGGEDQGARGYAGLLEKDVVLDLSLRLEKVLQARGVAVRRTRSGDEFVPLALRTQAANEWNADVFISLHTNASLKGESSGLHVYYLDTAGDEAARLLAERENDVDSMGGGQSDVQFMLGDLMQGAKAAQSLKLAQVVAASLNALAPNNKRARAGRVGVKKAPFYVLVGAHMPCVLVELLFIDSPEDAKRLADTEFRDEAARRLADAVISFSKLAPAQHS
ncbi:MAG: N-acetylmuramoyl-L-alanine amidase [Oligoflexia bacterium]|nr:N-acetylmuramoyl-L-alanine amidase [Oligoflexia bacterium]